MTPATGVAKELNHEEIFLERYNRLLKWAFQLTKPDHELAKDLVQDAFIQFTGAAGNLIAIANIDNYLFGVVRNTYLSHRRRNFRKQQHQLTAIPEDSSQSFLLSFDPRRQMKINDELRAICHHACERKNRSITGSILILRYFHGYVPSEMAKLINSSRNIVDVQLRSARAEAIACLETAKSGARENKERLSQTRLKSRFRSTSDLLSELRDQIFATRRGRCFDSEQLTKLYRTHKVMPRTTLSHLVSCARCLDEANHLLDLAPLDERNVIDVLGRAGDSGANLVYTLTKLGVGLITSWHILTTSLDLFGIDYLI